MSSAVLPAPFSFRAGGGGGNNAKAAGAAASKKKKTAAAAFLRGGDPNNDEYSSLDQRMSVDKNVVDELLLVCGVIGTATGEGGDEIVPVTDCLNWLQDLQRALRRDDDSYRPISTLLGDWRVVQQKLLPLVVGCRYDTAMVLTVCKILVILTKPLSENANRAGRMIIDTKKSPEEVVKEQIKMRENALKQAATLMEYKRAICHHPSHLNSHRKGQGAKSGGGGILSVFVSLLAEPLSRTGTARTDTDHLTIELVLHLFRNLLSAEPLLHPSAESAYRAMQLHNELVSLLERELVLEILLVLGADLEQRENQPYNLLVMELLHHLLRHQDPTAVARSSSASSAPSDPSPATQGGSGAPSAAAASSRLRQQLSREKQSLQQVTTSTSSRHSHFGGTLVLQRGGGGATGAGGRKQLISAARIGEKRIGAATAGAGAASRRRNKKMEPFIGNSKSGAGAAPEDQFTGGPAQQRALRTLDNFCLRFVADCYGPVMKSLKNEFRRDSVRLEEGDRAVFFRIVWFFCQWWRVSGRKRLEKDTSDREATTPLGQLIFTMDIFTFKLVLDATDHFQQHKKYPRLAQSVALLGEMMHLLNFMYVSKESTEHIMALGLMDRLFYGSEPLDRLPKLLSSWQPNTSTREYLCSLAEVCHMTLKLLEANATACQEVTDSKDAKFDTIAKMKAAAADFDMNTYLSRKIVSNHTVFVYTQLLSQYALNAPHTNHRIIAFFLRLSKIKIAEADDSANDPDLPQNLLATKTVTLEPMLYNVQLLIVLDKILNDKTIRKDKNYASLLTFATNFVYDFAKAARSNPLLFVEALFRHPVPHRFCDLSTNMYVGEELRMIAERELLLDEQQRLDEEAAAAGHDENEEDANEEEEEDDELEFEDFGITGGSASEAQSPMNSKKSKKKKKLRRKKEKRKAVIEDSDEDSDSDGEGGKDIAKNNKESTNDSDDDNDGNGDDDEEDGGAAEKEPSPSEAASAEKKAEQRNNNNKRERGAGDGSGGSDSDSDDDSMDDEALFGIKKPTTAAAAKQARLSSDDEANDADEANKQQ